jgi:hypothetical protein
MDTRPGWPAEARFQMGDPVRKKSGARWRGRVVGWYSTALTQIGYAVESTHEPGSVQIYPESALEPWTEASKGAAGRPQPW